MLLFNIIKLINKTKLFIAKIFREVRIWFLKVLYKGRFSSGNNFFFKFSSQINLDISESFIHFGDWVHVRDFCVFRSEKNGQLSVGNNVFFNNNCSLNCLGKIVIGNYCQFGEGVKMYDHNHGHINKDKLIAEQGYEVGKISIGDNCWLGSNVVILKDVEIGNNVVVGAGCVIYKSIPSGSVIINQQNLLTR